MKLSQLIIFATISIFCHSVYADDTKTEPVKTVEPATVTTKASDELLRFILDKAKLYSGKVEDTLGKGIDLAEKEAPETVRQYLVWGMWKNALMFAFPLVSFVVFSILCVIGMNKSKGKWQNPGIVNICTIVCGFLAVIFFSFTLINIDCLFNIVQIHLAPRIYILEQLRDLLHK